MELETFALKRGKRTKNKHKPTFPFFVEGLLFSRFLWLLPWAKEVHLHSRTEVCVYLSFCVCVCVCCPLHHPALTSSPSLFWKWKCQIAKEGMKEAICNRLCWVTVSPETNTPVLKLPRTLAFISVFLYTAEDISGIICIDVVNKLISVWPKTSELHTSCKYDRFSDLIRPFLIELQNSHLLKGNKMKSLVCLMINMAAFIWSDINKNKAVKYYSLK